MFCARTLALVLGCQTTHEQRDPAAISPDEFTTDTTPLPPTELGEVWTSENVTQANEIVDLFRNALKTSAKPGEVVRRDAHPKHHACVKSVLQIDPSGLPNDEQVGLYARQGSYNAWIRFSNADPSGDAKADLELDQRGMAVKILGVSGSPTGNHDLVMMDHETFFSKDGANYLPMTKALLQGGLTLAGF